ncbi:UNVERIFIED_CONTAM: hypothetical protein HHA_202445 [Hammondia hammondi]|eukprot:XP_008884530.1 hypothetical protein HHA_202445 [Hammondia hammondi]
MSYDIEIQSFELFSAVPWSGGVQQSPRTPRPSLSRNWSHPFYIEVGHVRKGKSSQVSVAAWITNYLNRQKSQRDWL